MNTAATAGAPARATGMPPPLLYPVLVWSALYIGYAEGSRLWSVVGGIGKRHWCCEIPLFVIVAWCLHFPWKRASPLAQVVAAAAGCLPLLVGYAGHDVALAVYQHPPRFSELGNLGLLFDVSIWWGIAAFAAPLLAIAPAAVLACRWYGWHEARRPWPWFIAKVAVPLALVVLLVSPIGGAYLLSMVRNHSGRVVAHNGRATAFIYDWHRARQITRQLRDQPVREFGEPFTGPIATPRNVYVVVLESFADPRLLAGASFTPDPLHPDMAALLGDRPALDMGISPVFGGKTAQAEFEIIAGVPALAELDSIDFQSLHGHPVHSLADSLRRRGYLTMATIATIPTYFNSGRAYPSLGFSEVRFIDSEPGLEVGPGEVRMFDGDLLEWSFAKAAARRRETGQPTFSYVLGLYGHVPFADGVRTRPRAVTCTSPTSSAATLGDAASVFYHRTGAVARWIEQVRKDDPDALVLVASDHLPMGLFGNGVTYQHDVHQNVVLAYDRGERLTLTVGPYYRLPYLLMERLTGQPQTVPSREELAARYDETMALGLGFLPGPPR